METVHKGFNPDSVTATLNTLIDFSESQFSQLKDPRFFFPESNKKSFGTNSGDYNPLNTDLQEGRGSVLFTFVPLACNTMPGTAFVELC